MRGDTIRQIFDGGEGTLFKGEGHYSAGRSSGRDGGKAIFWK